jgi:DNA repair ATPase RecN
MKEMTSFLMVLSFLFLAGCICVAPSCNVDEAKMKKYQQDFELFNSQSQYNLRGINNAIENKDFVTAKSRIYELRSQFGTITGKISQMCNEIEEMDEACFADPSEKQELITQCKGTKELYTECMPELIDFYESLVTFMEQANSGEYDIEELITRCQNINNKIISTNTACKNVYNRYNIGTYQEIPKLDCTFQ